MPNSFNILRTVGELKSCIFLFPNGNEVTVYRQEKLFIPEWRRFVMCATYDDHFIFENPSRAVGASIHLCSCGSPAVIVGANAYRNDASPSNTGELLVCLEHVQTGRHKPMDWR